MPTLRQSGIAAITRRYPLHSGCGSLANHRFVQWLAGPGTEVAWAKAHGGHWVAAPLDDYVGRAVFYSGELDRKITWVCSRVVCKGDTVLDIGANLGLVTFILSAQVGSTGRVHAFEPIPAMQELIDRGIARNAISNVRLHRIALGSEPSELTLSVPRGQAGSASFVKNRHFAESDEIRVPVRTLSEVMVKQEAHKIRLVKIDVEGFEPQVLAGATDFFARTPPDTVLFELMRTLSEFGYGFFSIPRKLFHMRLQRFPETYVGKGAIGHDFLAARRGQIYDDVAQLVRAW
jgi:FkbM family methyltransferase